MIHYLVVGAGSAGCVLANRLSADPKINVVLLEAGGEDRNPLFHIPKGFGKLMDDPSKAWHYKTLPFGPSQRSEIWPRGKVLGGSSSINGMVYNRGQRADYDELVRLGNPGWGWDTMLPIFRSFEDNSHGASDSRGKGGPLHVSPTRDPDPLCAEMIATGSQCGLTTMADVNESDQERIGLTMATIRQGVRVSAAKAFLHPVRKRPNLTVLTGLEVTELLFSGDSVSGVRARDARGVTTEFRAEKEVILSLGSLGTPKLLQLSGIGPAEVLRAAGVNVRLDRVNVGARMREHRCLYLKFRLKENLGANRLLSSPARQAMTALKYLFNHKGPLATPAYDVIAFVKSRPAVERPDGMLLMGPWSIEPYHAGDAVSVEKLPGVSVVAEVLRPTSEGRVMITSPDPAAPLHIDPCFFTTAADRTVAAGIFHRMREFFASEPIASRLAGETFPGADVQSDEDIINAALDGGYCGYHAAGTCAMGPNGGDVVDSQLRLRGLQNLRVVDCSVMPTMIAGNLNGPIMAMASRASDLILGQA